MVSAQWHVLNLYSCWTVFVTSPAASCTIIAQVTCDCQVKHVACVYILHWNVLRWDTEVSSGLNYKLREIGMQKSTQSTLLNAHGFLVRYSAAAAPCHSCPKAQGPLLNYESGGLFLQCFPFNHHFSLLIFAFFLYCTNMPWTYKLPLQSPESLLQFLLV